ncbi:MAG: hypothetical protein MJ158_04300 [Alphaproteobacteria bacterium]|nr:hypothetical protein [Alphaproteobacteria bacterium]
MMKKKNNKKSLFIICICLLCIVIGWMAHYTFVNWHGFFAKCDNGLRPDKNGCCAGEIYTNMGDDYMACCPENGEYCFPPIK